MKTLTIEEAKKLSPGQTLIHASQNNADGSPVRAKVNGQPVTWKTRPDEVRVPMKHGLRDTFQMGYTTGIQMDQPVENWGIPENGEEYEKRIS